MANNKVKTEVKDNAYITPEQAVNIGTNFANVQDYPGMLKMLDGMEIAFMPETDLSLGDTVAKQFSDKLTKAIVNGGSTQDILDEIANVRQEREDVVAMSVCLRAIDKLKSRGITSGKFSLDVDDGSISRVVKALSTRTVSKHGIDVTYGKEHIGSYVNGNDACKGIGIDAKGNSIKALKDRGYLVSTRTEPIPV